MRLLSSFLAALRLTIEEALCAFTFTTRRRGDFIFIKSIYFLFVSGRSGKPGRPVEIFKSNRMQNYVILLSYYIRNYIHEIRRKECLFKW